MKEIIKYTDIIRYGKKGTEDVLKKGDYITITEKMDGANASFRLDETNPLGVSCYSRNQPLNSENTLGGFYNWIIDNIVPIKDKLNPNYIYYGEWMNPHKVKYKEKAYKNFYMFSIWDLSQEINQYVSDEIVKKEANKLSIKTVDYFYEGEFASLEHLMNFIGKSNKTLEPNTDEGIVIKNVSYFNKYGRQCFVKLVSDAFKEVKKQRVTKSSKEMPKGYLELMSVLTKARIDKILYKIVDEGIISDDDICIENMGNLLKIINNLTYDDILKEESDIIGKFDQKEIRKMIGKKLPLIIKEILKERGGM